MSAVSAVSDEVQRTPEPRIQVLKGNPTDAELAALIAVLSSAGGGAVEPGPTERNLWGHPVDKLRYPLISWQRITLLERTHLRR
ncbi:MAG: acyl-CoA carboxylase subunit epsilon [Mycobacterium sp.]